MHLLIDYYGFSLIFYPLIMQTNYREAISYGVALNCINDLCMCVCLMCVCAGALCGLATNSFHSI